MSGYLLDTSVISEIARPKRDPRVTTFLETLDDAFISVVTLHELAFGLERLEPGSRRRMLTDAVERFPALYRDRLLSIGAAEARSAAVLRAGRQGRGRTLHLADALIAATALTNGLVLATRNVGDFEGLGVPLFDPWSG